MHLFYYSTLNTWRLITDKLPERPSTGYWNYDNAIKKYNAAIAALKQNALTVGNPEICPQNISAVEPDKLYEWPGGVEYKLKPNGKEIVAILTLPEEKKNTMENMTKEQAISKLWEDLSAIRDKYFLEEYYPSYWKIKEGFEHESQVIGDVLYFLDELTPSGSVAAPKENNLQWPSKMELPNHSEKLEAELAFLRQQLKEREESINEFIQKLTYFKHDTGIVDSSNWKQIMDTISRAKALLDKQ